MLALRRVLTRNRSCRQILKRRVRQSRQAAARQNRLKRRVNLAIAARTGEHRDYVHASIAPRHGSSSRYLVHTAISIAKRDA
jgi:hypothetical protein